MLYLLTSVLRHTTLIYSRFCELFNRYFVLSGQNIFLNISGFACQHRQLI